LISTLFWDVTQNIAVIPDVSGQPIGPTFKGQMKMGPKGRPETSIRNYCYTLRNITEDRGFPLLRGRRLKSCKPNFLFVHTERLVYRVQWAW